jgi:phenylacetate-CoA ligase
MEEMREQWLAAIERNRRNLMTPGGDRYWSPELDTVSRERLREIQSDKLPAAVAYMAANSAMYAQKLADAGVEPYDIHSIDDLESLPVVTKEDMSLSVAANPPWGDYTAVDDQVWKEAGWQLFQTSGTTAAPRAFRYTQRDRELWAWANARAVYAMGIRNGRDVGMMLFGYGPHVAMWGLHHALLLMGVPQLPVGGMDTRARAAMIDRLEPTVLGCTPSYALHLGAVMTDMGIDPARTAVRILIVMGEPTPPSTRRRIEELWGAEIHQFYGCTEVAPSCGGYTCDAGSLHFLEDTHVLETLDPNTWKPVPEGQPGVSVVTNLMSEASPQIRFVVGDYTTLSYAGCECGRTHVVCDGGFSGRADDMLNIRGVTLFPSAVEDVIRSLPELGEEFKIVVSSTGTLDEITLVVEQRDTSVDESQLAGRLETSFRAQLELRPTIQVLPYGTLPKTEFKAKRVDDQRA